jgi:hypothetical protein
MNANGNGPSAMVVLPPAEEAFRAELEKLNSAGYRKYVRFILAALSSVPWVGGLIGGSGSLQAEFDQGKVNSLQQKWLEAHSERLRDLASALMEVINRVEEVAASVQGASQERLETEAYLTLVRKGFRVWDQADTNEKRRLVQRLLANAGATSLTSDGVVRLFIDWIERYHEAHFAVIREVYANPGSTRADIWAAVHGSEPREDSAEADLFKLLIGDLSIGHVIRQHREKNYAGEFIKKPRPGRHQGSSTMKSAFDDTEAYELTELGKQFVHYAMTDVVPRIGGVGVGPSSQAKA